MGAAEGSIADDLVGLPDAEFAVRWPAMSRAERNALPEDLHRICADRMAHQLADGGGRVTNRPIVRRASGLLARAFEPIRWVVPGLLPEGVTLLAARPKTGKSWLALDLAAACAGGGTVLGRPAARGAVLYLALEDSDRRLNARLQKLGADPAALHALEYATEWPRGAAGAAAIAEWIDATPDARLVVVDVLAKLRAPATRAEQAYSADYSDMAMLKPPPGRGVSVLVISHTRKQAADDPLDTISGTLGLAGAADCAWVVDRARGGDGATLHLIGRDVEEEGSFAIQFDRETCRWQWVGEAWRVKIGAERRDLLDALAGGPLRPAEIAAALGKPAGTVRKLLHDMSAAGQVDRGIDGRYRPIEARE